MGSRPVLAFELHRMPLEELVAFGAELGVEKARKDLMVERILRAQNSYRWWDSMRKLRTVPLFIAEGSEQMVLEVERRSNLPFGTATSDDLDAFREDQMRRWSPARILTRYDLTRSGALTEIEKHEGYRGLTHLEIERKEFGDHIPTTQEVWELLERLGGPSSSTPERHTYDTAGALRRLGRTERFRGMRGGDIGDIVEGALVRATATDVARDFDFWERDSSPEGRQGPPPPPELLQRLREKEEYKGMTDQEVIEEAEGEAGAISLEGLQKILGDTAPASPKARSPVPKGRRWWDALRSYRTTHSLRRRDYSDEGMVREVATAIGIRPEQVTAEDVGRAYEHRRRYGHRGSAEFPREYDRDELLAELAKFPRYDGMTAEEIAGGESVNKIRRRLTSLGGPSSMSPKAPEWW